ncbi:MAG: Ribosome-recycling factor [Planctomycetes bacterium]|nr:Ribosome-recycling factor [Planctomycetota bacterium]
MFDDILLETEEKMDKAVEHLAHAFRGIRTGRASPGLVDGIRVDYYGSPTPLTHMASISIPEPRLIMIKPFDASGIQEVVKAIQKSELGITPQSDGKIIRLVLPPLSEERRKQLSAMVKDKAEEARVAIRNVRRDGNKQAKAAFDEGKLPADDEVKLTEEIQNLTKQYEGKVDDLLSKKTKEILEV